LESYELPAEQLELQAGCFYWILNRSFFELYHEVVEGLVFSQASVFAEG